MSMEFRDPRVLSETVETNSLNLLAGPPEAESVPDSDRAAGSVNQPGKANTNSMNLIPPLTPIDDDPASHGVETGLDYPNGAASTNVTRGPDERDEALDRSKGLTGTAEPTGPIDPVERAALAKGK